MRFVTDLKVTGGESGVRICSGYIWLGGLSEKVCLSEVV